MEKHRLEAFSDATIAIIITIMVLDLRVPHEATWVALLKTWEIFASYVLSFVLVGLFWYNHHLLFAKVGAINRYVLWINLVVLFLQSLLPFTTAWVGKTAFASAPVALYAVVNGLTKVMIIPLIWQLKKLHGAESAFAQEFGRNHRLYWTIGMDFTAAFLAAIGLPKVGFGVIGLVAILWFFPNVRFNEMHSKS
jgi:uncharacterized membrane protein